MTDFRRPDLDLWDEEDDGEEQRPTIVSERPARPLEAGGLPPLARMSLMQRLIARGELEDSEELRSAFAAERHSSRPPADVPRLLGQPKRPASVRPAAREHSSPIETATRAAADAIQPESTEILDAHELDLLRLSEPSNVTHTASSDASDRTTAVLEAAKPLGPPLPQGARLTPSTEPLAAARRHSSPPPAQPPDDEIEDETAVRSPGSLQRMDPEDFVPTRLARRPRGSAPAAQRKPPAILDAPAFRDREITERISIPPLASSIAPAAARTVRPLGRPQKGMGGWQLALVATLLIGAGLGVARLRRESATGISSASQESAEVARAEPSPAELAPVAEPAAEPVAEPAAPPSEPVLSDRERMYAAAAEPAEPPSPKAARRARAAQGDGAATRAPAPAAAAQPEPKPAAARSEAAKLPQPEPKVVAPRAETRAVAPEPEAKVAAPKAEAKPATQAEPKPARVAPAPAADLPLQPSRDEVRTALSAVIPELQKCVGDKHGSADVTMIVRSQGVVSYAMVSGSFAGTPEGSCIARSVKLAKFPAFSDPSVRVNYPFEL